MEHTELFTLRLKDLPFIWKLLITLFLVTIGFGYLVALVNVNFQYSMLDGQPGLSPSDLKRALYGDRTTTRLAAKINGGSMEQYLPNSAEKNSILNWIQDGASEADFNNNIKPVFTRNCMRCHSTIGVMSQRPLTNYLEIMEVVKIDRGEPPALWARVAHTHIQSIGIMLFLVGIIFMFSSLNPAVKTAVISMSFLSLIVDFGSRYLARNNADFVYVMMVAGAVIGAAMAAMILIPLYEMWLKKR